jgi:hypothetical protein
MRNLKAVAAVTFLAAFAGSASAIPIVGSSDPFNNTADFNYDQLDATTLRVSLTNTSNYDARITGFAFDLYHGFAVGLGSVTGTLDNDDWHFSFTGPETLEAYAITGPNLWGGDPRSGIAVNLTGVFDFLGLFGEDVALQNVLVRFQQTGADGEGSDKGYACTSSCTPTRVPEPSAMTLLGLGLIMGGVAVAWRRRSR